MLREMGYRKGASRRLEYLRQGVVRPRGGIPPHFLARHEKHPELIGDTSLTAGMHKHAGDTHFYHPLLCSGLSVYTPPHT